MASSKRKSKSQEYNNKPIINGSKKIWFLNGNLIRLHHTSRSTNIVSLYNITQDKMETCFLSDFKKNRQKAYTVSQTADLVNRHRKYIPRLIKQGIIPEPVGSSLNGKTGFQIRSYYSEEQVKEIRDILASIHIGQPRKDGLTTNNITPSIQELTRRMGNGILIYTKTEDGKFIPVWSESI